MNQTKWKTNLDTLDKIKPSFSYLNFPARLLWVVTVVPQCTEIIALDHLQSSLCGYILVKENNSLM